MANSKKSLMQEIDERIKHKKTLQKEMAARNTNIEEFVLKMMSEVDEMMASTTTANHLSPMLAEYYIKSIHQRLRVLDLDVEVEPSWHKNPGEEGSQLNGILIKWSQKYQATQNCEPELFVDVASLLFK